MVRLFRRGPDIPGLQRRGDVAGLRRALLEQDHVPFRDGTTRDMAVGTRASAVTALGEMEGDEAESGLCEGLADGAPEVRLQAVTSLAARSAPAGVDPMLWGVVNWEQDAHGEAVELAMQAFERWRIPTLPERFAVTFAEASTAPAGPPHDKHLARLLDVDARGPDHASQEVTAALLRRYRDRLGINALTVLRWLAPRSASVLLDELATRQDDAVLVELVGEAHDPAGVAPLCQLLAVHVDPEIRRAAAESLAEIRDPEAIPSLLAAAKDEAFQVRSEAGAALDAFGALGVIMGVASALGQQPDSLSPAVTAQLAASNHSGPPQHTSDPSRWRPGRLRDRFAGSPDPR